MIHSAGAKQQNSEHTDSTCTYEPPDIHTDVYEYRDPFFMCGICLAVFNMKRAILLCLLTVGTRAVTYNPFGIGEKHESWSLCTAGQPGDRGLKSRYCLQYDTLLSVYRPGTTRVRNAKANGTITQTVHLWTYIHN